MEGVRARIAHLVSIIGLFGEMAVFFEEWEEDFLPLADGWS